MLFLTYSVDIHQHLWPEPFLGALSRRSEAPRIVRRAEGWRLLLDTEPESAVDPADHDPESRAAVLAADGLDRALIAPSLPLGVEVLPRAQSEPLLAAYHDGVAALPRAFGGWASVVPGTDPGLLASLLDRGFAGACVAADALSTPRAAERLGPLLELLEGRARPLFVHPGPAATAGSPMPGWWAAVTDYVAAMQRAWYAFAAWVRPAHPGLRACFAMLAGLAPLGRERFVARGGNPSPDPGVFLDVSSYGERAIDGIVREVGVDRLVLGSDRPVVAGRELHLGGAIATALRQTNPARLLSAAPAAVPA